MSSAERRISIPITPERSIGEKCGIVALYNSSPREQLALALTAAGGVQHRGQQAMGVAFNGEGTSPNGPYLYTKPGLILDAFSDEEIKRMSRPSSWTLVHCLYGTNGAHDNKYNIQPAFGVSPEGEPVFVAHNGEFANTQHIRGLLDEEYPEDISDTVLFTQLLAQMNGTSWEEKLHNTLEEVEGAYSLAIGVEDKLFIVRDPNGIRPLVLGRTQSGGYIAASETFALDKIGAKFSTRVEPGEVIRIDKNGSQVIEERGNDKKAFCALEWAYTLYPNSIVPIDKDTRTSVGSFRERVGEMLAQEIVIPNASFVVGVPDSGVPLATGFANGSGIPYKPAITRDHTDKNGNLRTFMSDNDLYGINKRVSGKLAFRRDPKLWRGAIAVVGDDSMIRGSVGSDVTKKIFGLGAKEVHWVLGYPSVSHTCHLGGASLRSLEELIAARNDANPKKVAAEIGATSVNYPSPELYIKALRGEEKIVIPDNPVDIFEANDLCGGCITGKYPVEKDW